MEQAQFDLVTAENACKVGPIHPERDTYGRNIGRNNPPARGEFYMIALAFRCVRAMGVRRIVRVDGHAEWDCRRSRVREHCWRSTAA